MILNLSWHLYFLDHKVKVAVVADAAVKVLADTDAVTRDGGVHVVVQVLLEASHDHHTSKPIS